MWFNYWLSSISYQKWKGSSEKARFHVKWTLAPCGPIPPTDSFWVLKILTLKKICMTISAAYTYSFIVSKGAISAVAPTNFEKDWFYWHILIFKRTDLVPLIFIQKPLFLQVYGTHQKNCTHCSEIPTRTLQSLNMTRHWRFPSIVGS